MTAVETQAKLYQLVDSLPDFGLKDADGTVMKYPFEARKEVSYATIFKTMVSLSQTMSDAARKGALAEVIDIQLPRAVGSDFSTLSARLPQSLAPSSPASGSDDHNTQEFHETMAEIARILTTSLEQGTLDDTLPVSLRKTMAEKGYMVVETPAAVSLITHWELRRGHMLNPDDPEHPLPLPAEIRTNEDWGKTFRAYAKNETAQEQEAITNFLRVFSDKQKDSGFAEGAELRVFDTELSNPARTTHLVLQLKELFPEKTIIYSGTGFKPHLVGKTAEALDDLGVAHDLRVGAFAHKEALAQGRSYQPTDGKPYAEIAPADIVFKPFGAPYFGTETRDDTSVRAVLKDSGIALSLTNLGHDLRQIKDHDFGRLFRPDGKVPLHDASFGAVRLPYSNTIELPKVSDSYWSGLMTGPRANYGRAPDNTPERDMDDLLAFHLHAPPSALKAADRTAVLSAIKKRLDTTGNTITHSMALTVAPAPGSSPALKAVLAECAHAPRRDRTPALTP